MLLSMLTLPLKHDHLATKLSTTLIGALFNPSLQVNSIVMLTWHSHLNVCDLLHSLNCLVRQFCVVATLLVALGDDISVVIIRYLISMGHASSSCPNPELNLFL